jgi:hypothetical protein
LRNICFALLLSLVASLLAAIAYAFYPLISAVLASLWGGLAGAGGGGAGAVAGGAGESFLLAMLLAEPVFFLIIFALLQRRRALR